MISHLLVRRGACAHFCAWLGRACQDLSRSIPFDGARDIFYGGRFGELLTEREELAQQIETLSEERDTLIDENARLKELLESTSRNYQARGDEIAQYERLNNYRIAEETRLRAQVSHLQSELSKVAPLPERQRNKRLDTLAVLATGIRTGAPHSHN